MFEIDIIGIPYYASNHLRTHNIGVWHSPDDCNFVSTQRTDRTGIDRSELPQGALVNHKMIINAQALINISRKRLCSMADPETMKIWSAVKKAMRIVDGEMAKAMQMECIYRGFCGEFTCCGYSETSDYRTNLKLYQGVE
jgi:hypothetical protein